MRSEKQSYTGRIIPEGWGVGRSEKQPYTGLIHNSDPNCIQLVNPNAGLMLVQCRGASRKSFFKSTQEWSKRETVLCRVRQNGDSRTKDLVL